METVADGGGRVRWKPQKLTMEEYIFFVDNNKLVDLTVDQLNQIIDIHGFRKMHKTHKRILCEAVSTIELIKPSRSTLQDDGVSSSAVMSLDDVIKELNDLSWQECCVTSLQMINSVNLQQPQRHHLNTVTNSNISAASGSIAKTRTKRHGLRKLMHDSVNSNNDSAGDNPAASGSKAKPKRKRNKLRKLMIGNLNSNNNSAGGGDGVGVGGDGATYDLGSGATHSTALTCSSVIDGGRGRGSKAKKLVPKKKRSARAGGSSGVSGSPLLGPMGTETW